MTSPQTAPRFPSAVRHGELIYTSGLAAVNPTTLAPTAADFDAQCADVLAQLDTVLRDNGSGRGGVVKLECFLSDRDHFPAWNAAFAGYFSADGGTHFPARTTLIATLPIDGLLIEVQAVARIAADDADRPWVQTRL